MSRIEDLSVAGWRREHPGELGARIVAGLGVLLLSPTVLTAASRSRTEVSTPALRSASRSAPKTQKPPRPQKPPEAQKPLEALEAPALARWVPSDRRMRIALAASGLAAMTSLVYTAPVAPWARSNVLAAPAPGATGTEAGTDTATEHAGGAIDMPHDEGSTYSGVVRTADRTFLVDAVPAAVGINTVAITVLDAKGAPAKVEQWSATASLPGAGVPDVPVPLKGFGPGVAAADAQLPVAGRWTFTVTVRVAGAKQTSFTHVVPIGPKP